MTAAFDWKPGLEVDSDRDLCKHWLWVYICSNWTLHMKSCCLMPCRASSLNWASWPRSHGYTTSYSPTTRRWAHPAKNVML